MVHFSFEILQLIFSNLKRRDLLQCQLTCYIWYEASLEFVYGKVVLSHTTSLIQYVHTISNSTRLANYLRFINFVSLFHGVEFDDNDCLVKKLLINCPNILELQAYLPNNFIWTRLQDAIDQDYAPQLRCLPTHRDPDASQFAVTALSFKKTLTTLILDSCERLSRNSKYNLSNSYEVILSNIEEFRNLRYLEVGHHTDLLLSRWDSLIDKCRTVEFLNIRLHYIGIKEAPEEPKELVSKCYNIKNLCCDWDIIKCDEQLKYIMYKFPNLQNLQILFTNGLHIWFTHLMQQSYKRAIGPLSTEVLTKFINYVSIIPKKNITLCLKDEISVNFMTAFMNIANYSRNVRINYHYYMRSSCSIVLNFDKDSSKITFTAKETDVLLPHLILLSRSGKMIRSLVIENTYREIIPLLNLSETKTLLIDNWIFRTLLLCPFLQDLTIYRSKDLNTGTNVSFRHNELKSVSLVNIEPNTPLTFLSSLSFCAPNIKTLNLKYIETHDINSYGLTRINMPHTDFSLITWNIASVDARTKENFQYSIILGLSKKRRYFICQDDKLSSVSERKYNKISKQQMYFEIICMKLNEFKVIWEDCTNNRVIKLHRWNF